MHHQFRDNEDETLKTGDKRRFRVGAILLVAMSLGTAIVLGVILKKALFSDLATKDSAPQRIEPLTTLTDETRAEGAPKRKTTPAMASGLTDHVWSVTELLAKIGE